MDLILLNSQHAQFHLVERFSELSGKNNCKVPDKYVKDEPYLFVLTINNQIKAIDKTLKELAVLKIKLYDPPPIFWLERIGQSLDEYTQEIIDFLHVKSITIIDLYLSLINEVYQFKLKGQKLNYHNVIKRVQNDDLVTILSMIYNVTRETRDGRNNYLHKKQSNYSPILTEIYRVKLVTSAFKMEKENLAFNYEEGIGILGKKITDRQELLNSSFQKIVVCLTDVYKMQVFALGDVKKPSAEQYERAYEVIEYFDGGKKPTNWD